MLDIRFGDLVSSALIDPLIGKPYRCQDAVRDRIDSDCAADDYWNRPVVCVEDGIIAVPVHNDLGALVVIREVPGSPDQRA